tara:strand:- start:2019 stop:2741 length:723 start_codon:yes stop_codon:yes gene_type:complete
MQTSGRGRASRKFVSLPGQNLTFSVVLHPKKPASEIQIYSLLASVVVARVLENYVNSIRVKWPNDVIVSQKKICGILLEAISIPDQNFPILIMGIGLNTKGSYKDYPDELKKTVTTLEFEMLKNLDAKHDSKLSLIKNEKIFNQLISELDRCLDEFIDIKKITGKKKIIDGRTALLNEWLDRSFAKGRKVCSLYDTQGRSNSKGTIGIIEGLTSEGYLQIRTETGNILTHVSGDIIDLSE